MYEEGGSSVNRRPGDEAAREGMLQHVTEDENWLMFQLLVFSSGTLSSQSENIRLKLIRTVTNSSQDIKGLFKGI